MIVRIPEALAESIRQVEAIQHRILAPFAEVRARLSFPVETIELPEIKIEDDDTTNTAETEE